MDDVNSIWQVGIAALLAGALIGALAYRLFAPSVKHAGEVKSELDQAKDELETYKASVDEHFHKTSELVNELTQDYVKVYQHLAEGAQTLGDSKNFNNLLEQQKGRVLISVDESKPASGVIASEAVAEAAVGPAATAAKQDEPAEALADAKADAAGPDAASAEAAESPAGVDARQTKAPGVPPDTGEAVIDTAKLEVDADTSDAEKPAQASGAKAGDAGKTRPVTH